MSQTNEPQGYKWMIDGVPMEYTYYIDTSTNAAPAAPVEVFKEDLVLQVENRMKAEIGYVLNGTLTSTELLYCRPNDVIKYIESIGGKYNNDFDSNGWQMDYYFTVTVNEKNYNVCGDGYYSNDIGFSLEGY